MTDATGPRIFRRLGDTYLSALTGAFGKDVSRPFENRLNEELLKLLVSSDGIEQLRLCGVREPQLLELANSLALAREVALGPRSKMKPVRGNLYRLHRLLSETQEEISRLRRCDNPADEVAYIAIALATIPEDMKNFHEPFERFGQELGSFLDRVGQALERNAVGQSRSKADLVFPLLIDVALRKGWGIPGEAFDVLLPPTPREYTFRPSVSPTSAFYQVVSICWQELTGTSTEPERAIRSYLKELKKKRPTSS